MSTKEAPTPTAASRVRLADRRSLPPQTAQSALDLLTTNRLTRAPKFDESLEIAVQTTLDVRKPNQAIRFALDLPNGTGSSKDKYAIFTNDELPEDVTSRSDVVYGGDELLAELATTQSIAETLNGATKVIASEGLNFGRVARLLGPKKMMPNAKNDTLTSDVVATARRFLKGGSIEVRTDRQGFVSAPLGKLSFGHAKLEENLRAFLVGLHGNRPLGAKKGRFIKNVFLSTTMGESVLLDPRVTDPSGVDFLRIDRAAKDEMDAFNASK